MSLQTRLISNTPITQRDETSDVLIKLFFRNQRLYSFYSAHYISNQSKVQTPHIGIIVKGFPFQNTHPNYSPITPGSLRGQEFSSYLRKFLKETTKDYDYDVRVSFTNFNSEVRTTSDNTPLLRGDKICMWYERLRI